MCPVFVPVDIDECTQSVMPCDLNAECQNSPGSFSCACKTGYKGNGKTCAGNICED